MSAEREPPDAGRRRRPRPERTQAAKPPPPAQPEAPFAPLELISKDELESIHQAALSVV